MYANIIKKSLGAAFIALAVIFFVNLFGDFLMPVKDDPAPKVEVAKPEPVLPTAPRVKIETSEAQPPEAQPPEAQPPEVQHTSDLDSEFADAFEKATVEKGAKVAKKCKGCHKMKKGKAGGMGPNLWGLVGRPVGKSATFTKYSKAMEASDKTWTYAGLDTFIRKPQEFVPGTRMPFNGIRKTEDRANLIMFLRTLSDAPIPLP